MHPLQSVSGREDGCAAIPRERAATCAKREIARCITRATNASKNFIQELCNGILEIPQMNQRYQKKTKLEMARSNADFVSSITMFRVCWWHLPCGAHKEGWVLGY